MGSFTKTVVTDTGFWFAFYEPRDQHHLQAVRMGDEPYREITLEAALTNVPRRSLALVDMVIRLILDDVNVRKHALLTFNPKDFSDLCRKHQIEML